MNQTSKTTGMTAENLYKHLRPYQMKDVEFMIDGAFIDFDDMMIGGAKYDLAQVRRAFNLVTKLVAARARDDEAWGTEVFFQDGGHTYRVKSVGFAYNIMIIHTTLVN